jgi:hypothetical protein
MTNVGPLWVSKLCHTCQNALSRCHTLEVTSWLLDDVLGHQKGHVPPVVGQPPWVGLSQGVLDENVLLLLSCKGSTNHCPVSDLMGSQQPSDGLFSPMEVRTNHLPMCTGPLGTCPSGMVLHIKNFALHGLISPRDHSNVNHISSLILSNACIKPLAYHPIAQRHYNDLLYKAEEKDKMPYWASIHKKRKVSRGYHPSHVTRGGVVQGCPDIVKDRGDIIRGCLCRRRVVPVMDAILSKPFIAFILSFLYYFFFLFISRSN